MEFDLSKLTANAIGAINSERERSAQATVTSALRGIIAQQEIITKAKVEIASLQKLMREAAYVTLTDAVLTDV